MNDITALAQQLRATAEKANEHGEFNMAMHTVQVLALVEALEKAHTERDELQQGFIANQEEAREAIKYAYELKEQLARACAGREEAVREVEEIQKTLDHIHRRRVIWRGKAVTAEADISVLRQRIAELESRTVTVKLPEPFKMAKASSGLTYYYADEIDKALATAGINVEVE